MKTTDRLQEEHRLIKRFLDVITEITKKLVAGKQIPADYLSQAIRFARQFADRYHHYKEEYLLFGLLAQKNKGQIDAEIQRLRDQHEHLRNLIQEISLALESYEKGLDYPARILHKNFTEYVQTLRHHIRNEEHILFHLAEAEVTEQEDEELYRDFMDYEKKSKGKQVTDFEAELTLLEQAQQRR